MSVKRLGNKKYEIRGTVTLSTGKYHRYSFRKTFNSINDAREFELKYKESFNAETNTFENHSYTLKEFIDVYDLAKANQLKSSTKQSNMSIPLSEVHAICYRSPHNPLKKSIFFKS